MGFVGGHILDGDEALLAFDLDDAIDQQKRVAMRQDSLDLHDIEGGLAAKGRGGGILLVADGRGRLGGFCHSNGKRYKEPIIAQGRMQTGWLVIMPGR